MIRPGCNGDYRWDEFNTYSYLDDNYYALRDDDRQIISLVRDFFAAAADCAPRGPDGMRTGIDIGTGPNLYPAMTMLPFCDSVVLGEWSLANLEWLHKETEGYGRNWDPFWAELARSERYREVADPRRRLRQVAQVERASVFDLPVAQYDMGTMFFVAESCTGDPVEFHSAVGRFARSLRPGAPFAAAFMTGSAGYEVGDQHFPAVKVNANAIRRSLRRFVSRGWLPYAAKLRVCPITTNMPLRDGYDGMVLAVGQIRS
ncbi:SCO2525 family SAM-dependent methyltransferase [Luedemannella helvata]|uniref:SCO2525 family SAM-dependent methyltransferase n=1 Tax=Luedemannella helvata TaxID=349315 RepID=UPI0031E40113